MAIITNGLQLSRLAGAAFNQQLSASDYSEILAANKTAAELDAWTNAAVAAEFRNKTTTDIAKAVLANVGLSSVAGLEAWVAGQLTAGGGLAKAGANLLAMLNDYSNMSTTDPTYGASVVTFNQKTANSQVLSQTAGTATGTYAAVSTATPSAAFTLTTGVDLKTTGAGADTFTSVNPTAATTTLTAGDNLNGGAGVDTLNITSAAAMTLGAGVTMTDIENISVSASGDTLILDTALMTGVTSVTNSGSTAPVSVTGLKALVPVSVTATSNATTVAFASAVTAGTADAITVNINGVGASVITANGFETINVASSGSASGGTSSASNATQLASTSLTTLNVTGTAAAKLTANLVGASGSVTGTVTSDDSGHDVDITGRALTDKLSVTMAGGNDTVRVGTVAATHTISGGDGTDTLRYSGTDAVALAATANVTGIETVTLTGAASFAMTGAGVTSVNYTTAAAGTFGGLTTGGTIGLNLGGAMTAAAAGAAATATSTATTTAATYSGTADSLTVNVGLASHTANPGATSSTVSAVGVESVTFNSLAGSGVTEPRTVIFADSTATTQALKTITVTGSIPALTTVSVTGATSALTTVNLSGVTGGASFSGGAAAGAAITGGAGNDSLTGAAGVDTIIGGAGNDTITGGVGADVLTGGDGVDTFVIGTNTSATVYASNSANTDTITDFVAGVDKLSIAQGPVAYLGTFANINTALAANAVANLANQAAYITGENSVYVFGSTGATLTATDTVIKMPASVTTMSATDFLLGAQGASNTVTLTAGGTVNLTNSLATSASGVTTTGDDNISGTAALITAATAINGGAGADTLTVTGAGGAVTLTNVASVETLNLTAVTSSATVTAVPTSITAISASAFGDTITTSATATSVTGGALIDNVTGGAGNDTIVGAAGNDILAGGAGTNSITGGDGDDAITSASATDIIAAGANTDSVTLGGVTYTSAATIGGGDNLDTLTFVTASNIAAATITGFETYTFAGTNTMTVAQLATANTAGNTVNGGGTETIVLTGAGGAVTKPSAVEIIDASAATSAVTFTATSTTTTTLTGASGAFDNIFTINVGAASNVSLTGGAGNDTFNVGHDGTSTFTAADIIFAGAGTADVLNITGNVALGTSTTGIEIATSTTIVGIDTINFQQTSAAVYVTNIGIAANQATQTINAVTTGVFSFTAVGTLASTFSVTGGSGDDIISGGDAVDTLNGGAGSDSIFGGAGNDVIDAGSGNNTVNGALGVDTITLTSGGADQIRFASATASISVVIGQTVGDIVIGFTPGALAAGGDKIVISSLDLDSAAGTAVTATNQSGDITTAEAAVFSAITPGNAGQTFTTSANIFVVSGSTGTSLTSALNGATVTGTASGSEVVVVYYNASLNGGSMVVSMVDTSAGTTTTLEAGDTETILITGAMTPANYALLTTANFGFYVG